MKKRKAPRRKRSVKLKLVKGFATGLRKEFAKQYKKAYAANKKRFKVDMKLGPQLISPGDEWPVGSGDCS